MTVSVYAVSTDGMVTFIRCLLVLECSSRCQVVRCHESPHRAHRAHRTEMWGKRDD